MIDVQLFIDGNKVDLFNDESIQITDSIQDAKDIGAIFTTYSESFTLPASQKNNELFKHYYNWDILNGFDARVKTSASIKVNGIDRYNGYIELQNVRLKQNKPIQYNIYFVGLTSELKDIVKDDKLSDLTPLSAYDHDFERDTAELGFINYLTVSNNVIGTTIVNNSDICYPFITHSKRYVYTNDVFEVDDDNNITANNLDYKQLKPAIRLKRIVEAIEQQYDITFDSNFLDNDSTFNQLFMWLHRNKGVIVSDDLFNLTLDLGNFDYVSGDDNKPSNGELQTEFFSFGNEDEFEEWSLRYSLVVTGTGNINYSVVDGLNNNEVLAQGQNISVANETINFPTVNLSAPTNGTRTYKPIFIVETTDVGITELDVLLNLRFDKENESTGFSLTTIGDYNLSTGAVIAVSKIVIQDQIPPMTVIDFLTSLFKLFNLTAYVKKNGNIFIETLDEFYSQGNTYDITNRIDISKSEVSRLKPYNEIDFRFKEPKTFLIQERNVRTDDEYGNLEYKLEDENKLFTGGKYDVEVGFDKMLYERLTDSNGDLTTVLYGRYVDEKQDPTFGKPLIFLGITTASGAYPITFQNSGNQYTSYIRPSNGNIQQTINFGTEIDEFFLSQNNNSLFNTFYSTYIERIFSPSSRLIDVEAYLTLDFIYNYNLNDTVVINNRRFNINDIQINLNTGKAKLKLINITTAQNVIPSEFIYLAISDGSGLILGSGNEIALTVQ